MSISKGLTPVKEESALDLNCFPYSAMGSDEKLLLPPLPLVAELLLNGLVQIVLPNVWKYTPDECDTSVIGDSDNVLGPITSYFL